MRHSCRNCLPSRVYMLMHPCRPDIHRPHTAYIQTFLRRPRNCLVRKALAEPSHRRTMTWQGSRCIWAGYCRLSRRCRTLEGSTRAARACFPAGRSYQGHIACTGSSPSRSDTSRVRRLCRAASAPEEHGCPRYMACAWLSPERTKTLMGMQCNYRRDRDLTRTSMSLPYMAARRLRHVGRSFHPSMYHTPSRRSRTGTCPLGRMCTIAAPGHH